MARALLHLHRPPSTSRRRAGAFLALLAVLALTAAACSSSGSSHTSGTSGGGGGGPTTAAVGTSGGVGGASDDGGGDYSVDLTLTGDVAGTIHKTSGVQSSDENYSCNEGQGELTCSFGFGNETHASIRLETPVQAKTYEQAPEPTDKSVAVSVNKGSDLTFEYAPSGVDSGGTVTVLSHHAPDLPDHGDVSAKVDVTLGYDNGDQHLQVHLSGTFSLPVS